VAGKRITNAGLTKIGIGTLTLSGVNTYTGASVIKSGTLKVNTSTTLSTSSSIMVGDTGSSNAILDATTAGLTVGSSQILAGIGKVFATGKTLTVSGTISPGDGGIGNLSIDGGSLTLDGSSKFAYTLGTSSELVTSSTAWRSAVTALWVLPTSPSPLALASVMGFTP
jgi:fibronectin-binding autotransporter adhesin